MESKPSFVYLLVCSDGSTYVGATVNLDRRIRQHNKIIKGGAKLTGKKVEQGKSWKRVAFVKGFPNWSATLQFEWRWKQLTRKVNGKISPLAKRLKALNNLLNLKQSTSKAVPYTEWDTAPEIIFEDESTSVMYNKLNDTDKINKININVPDNVMIYETEQTSETY